MKNITVLSQGQHVPVTNEQLHELHAAGMSWYAYEKLRATQSHEDAIAEYVSPTATA